MSAREDTRVRWASFLAASILRAVLTDSLGELVLVGDKLERHVGDDRLTERKVEVNVMGKRKKQRWMAAQRRNLSFPAAAPPPREVTTWLGWPEQIFLLLPRRPLDFRASEQRCLGLKLSTLLVATTSTTRQPSVLSLDPNSSLTSLAYIAVFCAQPPLLRELGVTVASLLWAFFHELFALEVAVGSTPASPPFVLPYVTTCCTWCLPFAWSAAPSTVSGQIVPLARCGRGKASSAPAVDPRPRSASASPPPSPSPSRISCSPSSPLRSLVIPTNRALARPCSIECRLAQPGPACLP